jgi:hypothetical protein
MTISLASLARLVKAAIDGRLPHGMDVARLTDLPAVWSPPVPAAGLPARTEISRFIEMWTSKPMP